MKKHAFNLTLAILGASALWMMAIVQMNIETRERGQADAEAAEEAAIELAEDALIAEAETKVKLVTLKEALAMKEEQRENMQIIIDFILDSPDFVTITATDAGEVLRVAGDPSLIGWTRDGLLALPSVHYLLPAEERGRHRAEYRSRVEEGRSGETHRIEGASAIAEDGSAIKLDGVVLWHQERGKTCGFFAPAK